LLEEAKKFGVPGGSAFRAVAGFGRHGQMHEETFFELSGELPLQIEFILNAALADQLLENLCTHKLNLFYVRYVVESGVL
jgi:PII-like signaling protein